MLISVYPQAPQNWIETLATADMVVGVGELGDKSLLRSHKEKVRDRARNLPTRKMEGKYR